MKQIITALLFLSSVGLGPVWAGGGYNFDAPQVNVSGTDSSFMKKVRTDLGGYMKIRGRSLDPSDDSLYDAVDSRTYLDGTVESRLKAAVYFSDKAEFETHYEIVFSEGDTQENQKKLERLFPGLAKQGFILSRIPEDDRRLFDLTSVISNKDDRILYHRIDRLVLTLKPDWGVIRVGRQAVTWGNGMIFNPMDLFNPFSPTDIEREYKLGDDMVSVQTPLSQSGDLEILAVPRKNPKTSEASWNHSSLAAKYHFFWDMREFSLMAARHYQDYVLGAGCIGYLGNAAWRTDVTWTCLDSKSSSDNFFSLIANMDYSWVWWKKNCYGFLEFYYSGIGEESPAKALEDPDILERIDRGELFVLGRTYLDGSIRAELHPLVNAHLTAIMNMKDPSAVIQPRITYDITQNSQILVGADIPCGPRGSEFGGVKIPGTDFTTGSGFGTYAWVSYYF